MQVPTKIKRGAFLKAQTGKTTVNFHESQARKSTGQSLKSTWDTLCQRDWCLKDRNPIPWIHFPMKGYRKQRTIYLHFLPILSSLSFFLPASGSNLKTSNFGTTPPFRMSVHPHKISQDSREPLKRAPLYLVSSPYFVSFTFFPLLNKGHLLQRNTLTLNALTWTVWCLCFESMLCHRFCIPLRPPRACMYM